MTVKAGVAAGREVDQGQGLGQDQAVESLGQDPALDQGRDLVLVQDPGLSPVQDQNLDQDQEVVRDPDLGLQNLAQGPDPDQLSLNLVLLLGPDQVQLGQGPDQDQLNQAPDLGPVLQLGPDQVQQSPDQPHQLDLSETRGQCNLSVQSQYQYMYQYLSNAELQQLYLVCSINME